MKVLHIITDVNVGGAGKYLETLCNFIDRENFSIHAALPEASRLIPMLESAGVPYTETPHIAECSFSIRGVLALYDVIKRVKPDITHTHASFAGRAAARLYNKGAVVYTRHTLGDRPARGLKAFANNLFADAVVAVSPVVRDYLLQSGVKAGRIHMIYNGSAPVRRLSDGERAGTRRLYGVPDGAFVVCMTGRLTASKGQDVLINAVKGLDGVYALLAGDGPDAGRLAERLTDEHIQNIKLTGFLNDVAPVLNISDVQVNASTGGAEALSLSVIEGMSAGLPSVAADTGGLKYVVGHGYNGLLTPPGDAEALRGALLTIKNDGALRERFSVNALARYGERFTAPEFASRTQAVYEGLYERLKRNNTETDGKGNNYA